MHNIGGKNCGYLLAGAVLGAIGFAVFVSGFAMQWGAGGGISLMALVYYFVGLVVMSLACMKCCCFFGVCDASKPKK